MILADTWAVIARDTAENKKVELTEQTRRHPPNPQETYEYLDIHHSTPA